jgi:hypothetical protein
MRSVGIPKREQVYMARSLSIGVIALIASPWACSTPPLAVRPSPYPGFTISVDESPAWSHGGRTIAFHRRVPSAAGPAGVYLTTPYGGGPRFLAPGSFFFPNDLTFSPDDRYLAGVEGYQLWICEVATGQVSRPMYTGEGMFKPDWSPDGRKILYSRLPLPSNIDSGGIHIFDLATATDTALKVDGRIVYTEGDRPLWTRDGNWIACTERPGSGEVFSLIRADGSERRDIFTRGGWQRVRRYYRPAHGRDGFLFSQEVAGLPDSGSWYVNADGSGLVRTAHRFIFMEEFSPDGSEYVWWAADAADTNYALVVMQTDDATGTSRRAITRYEPPPGSTPLSVEVVPSRPALGPELARVAVRPR